jgi:hypothetical protein
MWLQWRCWSFDEPGVGYTLMFEGSVAVGVYTDFDNRACEDAGGKE